MVYTSAGLVVLFSWLLWGDFSYQLRERGAQPIVTLLLRKFGASDFFAGLFVMSLPAALSMFLAPIISYRSDRHRGRWGRRIPYLLATAPIAAVGMSGLAFSPIAGALLHHRMGWSPGSLNQTVITFMGASWVLYEFAVVTSNSLYGALVNDVVPRALIGRFYGLFRVVSLLSGMLFGYFLLGHAKEHFMPLLIGIGVLYAGGITLMCLRVKEGEYPPPEPVKPGQAVGFIAAVKSYFRDCFSKPYYLWVFAALALAQVTFAPVNLFAVYAAESFGMSMATYGKYIFLMYSCSLVLAYPLGWLADRFHATRIAMVTLAIYAAVMAVGGFVMKGPASFGIVFLLHGVLSGCYFTGAAALAQMLLPKLKFAQFTSAASLLQNVGLFVVGPATGKMLDLLGHDYRYTFLIGCVIALVTLWVTYVAYRHFEALGGAKGYVAPE
ncbi:MAG: Major Facilitator Superfamily protein [Verrucomicrobia bacterium]|nr:Major Facilitator Superfamily protein [Verrucomicrobiota bacterium]